MAALARWSKYFIEIDLGEALPKLAYGARLALKEAEPQRGKLKRGIKDHGKETQEVQEARIDQDADHYPWCQKRLIEPSGSTPAAWICRDEGTYRARPGCLVRGSPSSYWA
jgi:hypothetical protein